MLVVCRGALAAAACALLVCLCLLALQARQTVMEAGNAIARTADAVEQTACAAAALAAGVEQIADARLGEALEEVRATRRTADTRLGAIQTDARDLGVMAVSVASVGVQDAAAEVRSARADLGAVLRQTEALAASSTRAVDLLTPQALGAVAAAKVALGETAQAARRLDAALPAALVTWEQIGERVHETTQASADASRATARTMQNLEAATRPLPRWLRYPLSITGAVAPTVAGAVSAAAATGAFR